MATICLSQIQAVAGSSAALSFSESKIVAGGINPLAAISKSSSRSERRNRRLVVSAAKKKVNAYDDAWEKGFFSQGIFSENTEKDNFSIIKTLEKKKLLTGIEKAGLLSTAEKFGLTLSKVEKLGLLSKAEKLGLLGFLEGFAATDPAAIASGSIPLFVAALLFPILIPDEPSYLVAVQYTLAALSGLGGVTLFGSAVVLGLLQED